MEFSREINPEQSDVYSENWEEVVFSEVIEINPKRDLKKGETAKFVSMADLEPFQRKVRNSITREFKGGSKFKNGDTLLARITPCLENGKTSFVDILDDEEIGFGSTEFIVLSAKRNKTDPLYVYYLARSPGIRKTIIKSMTGTSGRQRVENAIFDNIVISLPSPPEQRAISGILSDFDSKIELNQRMNETLEAIGQAVFKRWFVDFEFPNEEGKPYKSSGGSLVDSDIGEIPNEWATGGLGSICDITMGQSPPGETYNETGVGLPFFQGIRDFGFRFPNKRVYCTAPTRFAEEGDVLLSVRAPIGSLNVAEERCAIGRGVAALRLKGKQNGFLYYLLVATRSAWNEYEAKGTVFGSATKQDVHNFRIIMPPKDLRDKFGNLIESSDGRILLNHKEIRTLSTIRDSLLPRLMSGRIRVNVLKKIAEES